MFIVSKIDLHENKIDIINVVDEDINYDRLVAYESMIKDALQYGEGNSVKNINEGRIEIYIK